MKVARTSLLAALLATALLAAPPWVEDYERGLLAAAAGDWPKVAAAMQSASRQNPNEAVTLKLRRRTVSYVPWYWLGLAQLQNGEAAAALESLRRSQKQGVIEKTPLYADFRKALSRAEEARSSPRGRGSSAAGTAAFQNAVKAAVASQGKAMLAGSTRGETYRRASQKLQEARERARSEAPDDLAEGAKLAMEAESMFRRAAEEQASAKKTSKTVRATTQPAAVPPESVSPEATQAGAVPESEPAPAIAPDIPREAPAVAVPSPRLVETTGSMLRSLRKQAASERAKGDPRVVSRRDLDEIEMRLLAASTDSEVATLQREIARELEEIREVAAAPAALPGGDSAMAAALEKAYRELAAGRPEESERLLSDLLASSESAEAYLLRGCARYTQGTLAKRKDLVDAAREDLGRAVRLNPRLRLDERSFSPKLVALLAEIRKAM